MSFKTINPWICKKCKTHNIEDAIKCVNCGEER